MRRELSKDQHAEGSRVEEGGTKNGKPPQRRQGPQSPCFSTGLGPGRWPRRREQRAGCGNVSHYLRPLGPAPFLLFTLMVTPRKQQTVGSVARFLNGESDEIRKEKVIVYICFERFFYLFKETLKRVSLLWASDI